LNIQTMSRVHALLCYDPAIQRWRISDASSHGTSVNAIRIAKKEYTTVNAGDVISFAKSSLSNAEGALLVQGPDDAKPEEGDVDTTEFRKEIEEQRKKQEADLQRRKEARKAREFRQAAMLRGKKNKDEIEKNLLKEKKEQANAVKEDQKVVQDVSWGMGDDEVGEMDMGEEDNVLQVLDYTEIREKHKLTEKQEQMVTKLEQKQKKLDNQIAEKERLERKLCEDQDEDGRNKKQFFATRLAELCPKIAEMEANLLAEDEQLRVALGLQNEVDSAERKRRITKFDNNVLFDSEDEFFDQTKVKSKSPQDARIDEVETAETLGAKVAALEAQIVRINADMISSKATVSDDMDELDAFMAQNQNALSKDKNDKFASQKEKIEAELAEMRKLLEIAQENNDADLKAKPQAQKKRPAPDLQHPEQPPEKKTVSIPDAIQAAQNIFASKAREREAMASSRTASSSSSRPELPADIQTANDDEEIEGSVKLKETEDGFVLDEAAGGLQLSGKEEKGLEVGATGSEANAAEPAEGGTMGDVADAPAAPTDNAQGSEPTEKKKIAFVIDEKKGGLQVPGALKPKKVYTVLKPPGM